MCLFLSVMSVALSFGVQTTQQLVAHQLCAWLLTCCHDLSASLYRHVWECPLCDRVAVLCCAVPADSAVGVSTCGGCSSGKGLLLKSRVPLLGDCRAAAQRVTLDADFSGDLTLRSRSRALLVSVRQLPFSV